MTKSKELYEIPHKSFDPNDYHSMKSGDCSFEERRLGGIRFLYIFE